jgi:hypothetical protein
MTCIRKENLMNKLSRVFLLAILPLFAFACGGGGMHWSAVPLLSAPPMLEPGDKIDTMVITTGTEAASPLWAVCLPTVKNDHLITINCGEVPFSRLAIGHTFGVMDLLPEEADWSELTWELSLDDHAIDLDAFGTYSFVHPDIAPNPSPIKEVFRSVKVWDVVLENPTPGTHVLYGRAHSKDETYTWMVNFIATTTDMQVVNIPESRRY